MSARRWRHGVNRWHVMGYLGLILVVFTLPVYEAYPSSYDERPSRVMFRLPLDGPVTVAWGGADTAVNYHVFLPDQRWAYDLLVALRGGELSWGRHRAGRLLRLHAPCAGARLGRRLCGARWRTGCRDRCAAVGLGWVGQSRWHPRWPPTNIWFIGHLQPGSVRVQVGDHVTVGQRLGKVGNSGNSSEPHVHLHLQDTPRPVPSARGSRFTSIVIATPVGSSSVVCRKAAGVGGNTRGS